MNVSKEINKWKRSMETNMQDAGVKVRKKEIEKKWSHENIEQSSSARKAEAIYLLQRNLQHNVIVFKSVYYLLKRWYLHSILGIVLRQLVM